MQRQVTQIVKGLPATDGAGVELVRVIGQPALMDLDPFLLLDAFRSDNPDDYIAGFPSHPHRGFETVTYLLNGRMRHKDNTGREGVIEAGGIQWMTAGRGIIHSEMPEQEDGLLEGFQLWVNLPAEHKMTDPYYQEYPQDQIPLEQREGAQIRVITGETSGGLQGPVVQPLTSPLYLDISLQPNADFTETVPTQNTAFLYGITGTTLSGNGDQSVAVERDQLAILGEGDQISLRAGNEGSRFLLISGKPLREPIARGGPFVMNTREEINQAINDYHADKF
jgi:hypothetical protein